jgi:UDP-N-acetylglucosamine 4,6-dehydratase
MDGVDIVIHAAALKQIPSCEYNPFEAVKTNIIGAENIINTAIDRGVKKVIALSSDKAVNPINLYGATKLAMEKLFIAGNAYVGNHPTCFSIVRYGNVIGSRGSVVPLFCGLAKKGKKIFPITDEKMTRFWMALDQSIKLVLTAIKESVGGEIFIPRIPSMRIVDLAKAICPDFTSKFIGIRPGEKIHETLISEDEARNTKILNDRIYVILPSCTWKKNLHFRYKKLPNVKEGFVYRSDNNDRWLTINELKVLVKEFIIE